MAALARTPGSARARARAPRLQPSARSGFRCHCLLPGAAACSKLGVLSAGPLAPRQEDEFEEDAWAREYRDGCGPGGNRARAEDGLRVDDPPCGWLGTLAWYHHPDPDRDSGQPLPQPTPEGRKEGKVSEGARAGREPPPVRLETVATATGLRSPATRLRGGDAPSPTTAGGAGRGEGDALWREHHRSSGRSGCACLSTSRVGGEGERLRGHEPAPTWLQSSQQGSQGGCKRGGGPDPGPAAGEGGLEVGSGVSVW